MNNFFQSITFLFSLLFLVISCTKEETYPTNFRFENTAGVDQNVHDYEAVFEDSIFNIFGVSSNSSIRFIFNEGPNELFVGTKELSKNGPYKLVYKINGKAYEANDGEVQISYLNRFVNFTFMATFDDGLTISNGIAHQVWLNNNNPLDDPDFPIERDSIMVDTNLWNGFNSGLEYVLYKSIPVEYYPINLLNIQNNPNSITISAIDPNNKFYLDIEILKPLDELHGKNIDITQNVQNNVKVRYTHDKGSVTDEEKYDMTEGVFQLIHIKDDLLSFGFKGKIISKDFSYDKKIVHYCLGKNIPY